MLASKFQTFRAKNERSGISRLIPCMYVVCMYRSKTIICLLYLLHSCIYSTDFTSYSQFCHNDYIPVMIMININGLQL